MKYIIILPDGMADHPIEELNGKTPLEAANTTNMDYLAQNGMTGLVRTIPEGMHPGSDIGNMALLGYDPRQHHTGRAPLEAANLNILLEEDEIAVRCNLVTVEDGSMVDYSAGHISTKEAESLIQTLNDQMGYEGITFYPGKSYRHLVVMRVRQALDYCAMKTTPPHDIIGKAIKSHLPQGPEAEMFLKLMERSRAILENHPVNNVRLDLNENPANMIWLWGQGTKPLLPTFKDKFGLDGAIISAVDLVNGIGRLAGLEVLDVPGITGYYDTDYSAKAEYALKALETNDFIYVHIEAPDEAGHNGDYKAKIAAIEAIDQKIVGPILNHYGEHADARILVLPDHPTPVDLRTHTDEPVNFVMFGKGVPLEPTDTFSEPNAQAQGLRFNSGEELLTAFIKKYH